MTLIPQLHVGVGAHRDALTIFPVWVEGARTPGLSWSLSRLDVSERAGAAQVEELVVRNTATSSLPILEGDLFVGGQQNRMAAETRLLEPGQSDILPVRCVEQHRWSGAVRHEAHGLRAGYSVRYGRHSGTSRPAEQDEVWTRVERFERMVSPTRTSDLVEHLSRPRAGRGAATPSLDPLPLIDGQRGVIIGIAGRVVGCELFGSPVGLRERWKGILRAAALDATGWDPEPTPGDKAREFARRLAFAPRRDEARVRGIRRIAAGDNRTALTTEWVTDAAGRRVGLLHATAYNRTHGVLQPA